MSNTTTLSCPLPEGLALTISLLQKLVTTMEEGVQNSLYAFAVLEDLQQFQVHAARTESTAVQADRGIVLRILAGEQNFEYASNNFDETSLQTAAQQLRAQALAHVATNPTPAFVPPEWKDEPLHTFAAPLKEAIAAAATGTLPTPQTPVHFGTKYDPHYPETTDSAATIIRAQKFKEQITVAGGDALSTCGCMIRRKTKSRIFIDRTRVISQSLLSSLYYLYAVSPQGMTVREIAGGMAGAEVAESITAETIQNLINITTKLDTAPRITPGRYRIITGPDVTGVIAHEAFGHTQEGDTCRLGRSCAPALKKNHTKIGNTHASIINNAGVFKMGNTSWGVNGTHFFDDEGFLAQSQTILDAGYLSSPMNDLLSSIVGDSNGPADRQSNGKRENWRRPLIPRQTNTYFTAGDKTLDELAELCGDGFIAEYAHGGMEDPKGMGLTAGTEYFEEVKGGKRTKKLFLGPQGGHIELSDPVPRLLSSIIAKSTIEPTGNPAGSDPINKWGGCGKYHKELVEAGCGGPWILWESINCG